MAGVAGIFNRLSPPRRAVRWPQGSDHHAWFDRADALDVLERRRSNGRYDAEQYRILDHWIKFGYVIVDDHVPEAWIDGMLDDLDRVFTAPRPSRGLVVEQLRVHPSDPPGLKHADLLRLDLETRLRLRQEQRWRIHRYYDHSAFAKQIFRSRRLADVCSLIFDQPALPEYTINFMFGSEQHLHQDTCVFHVHPMNHLIGVWLACEDVKPGCGPLVFYPGSHKESIFPAFDNYPQTNLKTCDRATTAAYDAYLDRTAAKYPREVFMARKGQALLWHGMLIHGGEGIGNPALTRKSYVCHYIPKGMNKEHQIVGPFNW